MSPVLKKKIQFTKRDTTMARANHTHILFILDRSGSMQSIHADVIGGINQFFASQKAADGTADLTLVQFDTHFETVLDGVDIRTVEPYRASDFEPRGSTALYDAMGSSMEALGRDLAARREADRPANVVVAVMTDGEENASRHFTFERVQQMIEHQRSFYNWDVLFLASELRTLDIGRRMGVDAQKAVRWSKDSAGTMAAFSLMDREILAKRNVKIRPITD